MGIHNQPEGVGIISGFFVGHILRWNIIPPGPGFGAETLMDIAMINGDIMQYIYIHGFNVSKKISIAMIYDL